MSTSPTIPVQPPSATWPSEQELAPEPTRDRFDQMFGRMRGTMTIVGDIVGPDPEMWACERD
jgi:hypothetical protein